MKAPSKEHITMYGPIYALLTLVLGGGGVAKITDNLPVTNIEVRQIMEEHSATPHPITKRGLDTNADTIEDIGDTLKAIRLEQTRESLKHAYEDKCSMSSNDRGMEYIDEEIERLEAVYTSLTGRNYRPRPCEN